MQIVTREAIYYGLADCGSKASLINWALPYAQRYMHKVHTDKYHQLKESGFDFLNHFKVITVEQLFYRNVIKGCGSVSKNRVECVCLLQVCSKLSFLAKFTHNLQAFGAWLTIPFYFFIFILSLQNL